MESIYIGGHITLNYTIKNVEIKKMELFVIGSWKTRISFIRY